MKNWKKCQDLIQEMINFYDLHKNILTNVLKLAIIISVGQKINYGLNHRGEV